MDITGYKMVLALMRIIEKKQTKEDKRKNKQFKINKIALTFFPTRIARKISQVVPRFENEEAGRSKYCKT